MRVKRTDRERTIQRHIEFCRTVDHAKTSRWSELYLQDCAYLLRKLAEARRELADDMQRQRKS